MYGALCPTTMQNYLIYPRHFPLSQCLCSWQKCPLLWHDQITKPTLVNAHSAPSKTRSLNLLSPKNKELHFLLANDALIVQVNKLAPFFPWITKSLVPVCFFLFFVLYFDAHPPHTSHSGVSCMVCRRTLVGLFPCCTLPSYLSHL